jgi:hypothetical protein
MPIPYGETIEIRGYDGKAGIIVDKVDFCNIVDRCNSPEWDCGSYTDCEKFIDNYDRNKMDTKVFYCNKMFNKAMRKLMKKG